MKEYKIIRQKVNLLKNTDADFEKELNIFAHQGWNVAGVVTIDNMGMKIVLEREKNR